MKDYHNPDWHRIADDRPDNMDDPEWDWFSNLGTGVHSTWGVHTVKKFDNVNLAAYKDHPGIIRRIINRFIDG